MFKDDLDFPPLVSFSLEGRDSLSILLGSVSMATLGMVPPDVVMTTVGETVTVLAVVAMHSTLPCDELLVELELDSVVTADVESLLVAGSNCDIEQNKKVKSVYQHNAVLQPGFKGSDLSLVVFILCRSWHQR